MIGVYEWVETNKANLIIYTGIYVFINAYSTYMANNMWAQAMWWNDGSIPY